MNCKHVEDLLPLYAGHDLEDENARLVAAHLQNCTACAGSAREYEQASQLLQQFEPPQFSDPAYAAIRHSVLRKIEPESGTRSLRELLLGPFQPRLMWAVSTAVLLAVCAFAYYFVANRASLPPDQRANANIKLAPTGTAGGRGSRPGSPAGVLDSPATATDPSNSRLDQVVQHDLVAPRVNSGLHSPEAAYPRRHRLNQTAWKPSSAGEPPAVPGAVPATIDASVSSRKPMRLEMQTSDPNIRIIWFSQPSTNEGSPHESSKGI